MGGLVGNAPHGASSYLKAVVVATDAAISYSSEGKRGLESVVIDP